VSGDWWYQYSFLVIPETVSGSPIWFHIPKVSGTSFGQLIPPIFPRLTSEEESK
jgi:hypothetical protein